MHSQSSLSQVSVERGAAVSPSFEGLSRTTTASRFRSELQEEDSARPRKGLLKDKAPPLRTGFVPRVRQLTTGLSPGTLERVLPYQESLMLEISSRTRERRNSLTLDHQGVRQGALGAEGWFFLHDESPIPVGCGIQPQANTFTIGGPHAFCPWRLIGPCASEWSPR